MLYKIKSQDHTKELDEDFGIYYDHLGSKVHPIQNLTDEEVINAIIKHGRATITEHKNEDPNLCIRTIYFENAYD